VGRSLLVSGGWLAVASAGVDDVADTGADGAESGLF
jgi:hypothetical protein